MYAARKLLSYTCSQTIKTIDSKEIDRAKNKYINIYPSPVIELATLHSQKRRQLQQVC